ncbi:carbohydrate ABC transporter permease [Konateibacter massiliensis]|uniref:carbohydrate ABC transporter permease n=1 Tax=Konateibacter massiliensis TaxID=2002841 RepID=UPI000C15B3A5|nr:sugar ABC transporter permease [Konateibacter massiliensis]
MKSKLFRREEAKAYVFLMPSLLGVGIFILIPFCDAVRRSVLNAMGKSFVGVQNYLTVMQNEAFLLAAKNTLRFTGVCIPLLLVLSLMLSLLVYGEKRYGSFFKTTFLLPMAIPVAAVVLLWKIIFHKNGLLNSFLLFFDVVPTEWMNSKYAFHVLVFSYLWKNIGYDMILWLAGLSTIPGSLYEAAALDGAGRVQKFCYITLPMLLPTAFVISVLSLVNSFKVFREAYLIAGNYPDKSIYMIQHLFNNWFVNLEVHKMCAAAVIFAAAITSLVVVLGHLMRREEGANED